MGQNRWWLKLFFYLLDVGTFNALVVYNETQDTNNQLNFVSFKCNLVEYFISDRIRPIDRSPTIEHVAVRMGNGQRQRCAYCAVFGRKKRTQYMCKSCKIPFCCIENGKCVIDCFMSAHENETIKQTVRNKFNTMEQSINKISKTSSC